MMSHVHMLHTAEPSLELSTVLQLYIIITSTLCSLATWGKYKGNTQSINLLFPLKFNYSAYFI